MTIETFRNQIPYELSRKLKEQTVTTWAVIYKYVSEKGECCIDDVWPIQSELRKQDISINEKSVMNHLRRMAVTGLLSMHSVMLYHKGFACRFNAYTLPGLGVSQTKPYWIYIKA